MSDKYFTINLRAYLDKDEPTYLGEESLNDLLSNFFCPYSITYLVFNAETTSLAGYFSLAIKPISVRAANISKTMAKKISRVSILDEESSSYSMAAYLIAQIAKNYSLPKEERIDGSILLGFALQMGILEN